MCAPRTWCAQWYMCGKLKMNKCNYKIKHNICRMLSAARGSFVHVPDFFCQSICDNGNAKEKALAYLKVPDYNLANIEADYAALMAGDTSRKTEFEARTKTGRSGKKPCKGCGNKLPSFIAQAGSLTKAMPNILLAVGENLKNQLKTEDTHKYTRPAEETLAILQVCENCPMRANNFKDWETTIRCSLCGCYMELKAPIKGFRCANVDPHYMARPGWSNEDYWAEVVRSLNAN